MSRVKELTSCTQYEALLDEAKLRSIPISVNGQYQDTRKGSDDTQDQLEELLEAGHRLCYVKTMREIAIHIGPKSYNTEQ